MIYFDNVMYLLLCIPAAMFIEKFGIRASVGLGVLLSLIGSWIVLMVDPIGVKIFGQLLIDAGFPFGIGCVTKFTAQWFPYQERFYATSAASLMGMIGFGFGDASVFIYDSNKPIGFAITITVVAVLTLASLWFFKEKPDQVPSLSQSQKQANYEFDLKEDVKDLFKNQGFILGWIAIALFIAYSADVSKGLANIIQLGNDDFRDLEGITIFFFVPGLLSIMLPSYYLSRGLPHYRLIFLIIMLLCTVGMSFLKLI